MAAEKGDALSQFYLGVIANHKCHLTCESCLIDWSQCGNMLDWFQKAADQGYGPAQSALANNLRYSKGNYSEAAKWFRKAATQQDAYAEFQLGLMYQDGKGVAKDSVEARNWFRLALEHSRVRAERGEGVPQFVVGLIYKNGYGVPRNYVTAYLWLTLAASQGIGNAQANIRDLERRMPANLITEAQRLAKGWQPGEGRSAEAGHDPIGARPHVGAGLIISNSGLVLTVADIVTECAVIFLRIQGHDHPATVVATDIRNNLALLKIDFPSETLPALRLATKVGDRSFVYTPSVAAPVPSGDAVIAGIISGLSGLGNDSRLLRLSHPFQTGMAGSPVFDQLGNVIAVVAGPTKSSAKASANAPDDPGDTSAVKSSVIGNFLDAAGISYHPAPPESPVPLSGLRDKAKALTVHVGCQERGPAPEKPPG